MAQNTGSARTDTLSSLAKLPDSTFNDVLIESLGMNVVVGFDGNDTLNGGGADTSIGGAGNDTIVADSGAYILTGGLDADRFIFDASFNGGRSSISTW
jgi:Ca2+-binding RTX toxin-like protein